jgi:rod shape-determining protein MreD
MKKIRIILNKLRSHRLQSKLYRLRWEFQKCRKQTEAFLMLSIIMLLDATLFNHLRIFHARPDIILAALIIFSFFFALKWSVGFAFLGGIFRDSISILPFGFNTIICIFLVILAKRISQKFTVENIFIRSAMLFLIILLNNLIIQLILLTLGGTVVTNAFLRIAVTQSIVTLLLALPMYRIFGHLLSGESARLSPR